jgi:hypothetical protein
VAFLNEKSQDKNLLFQYLSTMIEEFKEYDNKIEQDTFDNGMKAGQYLAYMTNLAEEGKCLQAKWLDYQKYYDQAISEYRKLS